MSDSLALTPPKRPEPSAPGASESAFGVRVAALHERPAPAKSDPTMILMQGEDGGVVVYPPSSKLVILAAARDRLRV